MRLLVFIPLVLLRSEKESVRDCTTTRPRTWAHEGWGYYLSERWTANSNQTLMLRLLATLVFQYSRNLSRHVKNSRIRSWSFCYVRLFKHVDHCVFALVGRWWFSKRRDTPASPKAVKMWVCKLLKSRRMIETYQESQDITCHQHIKDFSQPVV